MDGRMYRVPQIEPYPLFNFRADGTAYELPYDYTYHTVFADVVVPNGTWVMERPMAGWSWPIGATWDELREVMIDKRPGQERRLYLADKPFGFVQAEDGEYVWGSGTSVPKNPLYLHYARQVHKGELGQGVPIPRLRFAREHPGNARKYGDFPRNRDQRRNPARWARLSDVVAASGVSAHQLLSDYWPFVGPSRSSFEKPVYQDDSLVEVIHLRFASDHATISRQTEPPLGVSRESMLASVYGGDRSMDRSKWIRAGLANTFLRLRALGYQPASTTASVA